MKKEKKLVPEIRFGEFEREWEIQYLGDLLEFKNGINASKEAYGSGYKFINVLDIIENDFITYDDIIGSVEVSEDEFNKNIVEYGDILFQRSSETRAEVGQSTAYLDKNKPATFGGFVIRGRKISDYDPAFLNFLLKTASARKEITSKSGGSTRYNVGQKTLSEVAVVTPCEKEQQKIADFLTQTDRSLQLLREKKRALEVYKKGVMQRLFSRELRFKNEDGGDFPEWEEKKLKEVFLKAQSGGTPKSTIKSYYDGDIPFLSISDMTEQGKYLRSTKRNISEEGLLNSSSWIVPKDSIIYSMYASVGFVSINKIDISTSQATMNIILKDNVSIEFIYYWLLNLKTKIHKYVETGTQGNINAGIVKNLPLELPAISEQQKIADFLAQIDEKIEKTAGQIERGEVFKKGLLQGMFV